MFALAQESAPEGKPLTFSSEQIRADFTFMYESLQAADVDLFAFTPRNEFETRFQEMRKRFVKPMTRFDVEMSFQPFVALAHQAHARIESDYAGYRAYRSTGGSGFPLEIAVVNDQLIVTKNSSGITEILPGDRITAINGEQMISLLPRLIEHVSTETRDFAYVQLEVYMPLLIWLELGPADSYAVSVDHTIGSSGIYEISVPADEEQDSGEEGKRFSLEGRRAEMLTETVAYLRPGPFYNTDPGIDSLDNTEFVAFVDAAFEDFIENQATHLILDFRDNPGGNNSFSDSVIAWFADRPFRFSSNFKVRVSPQSTAANQARLDANPGSSEPVSHLYSDLYASTENGKTVLFPIPEVNPRPTSRYDGQVYVLVNRYSFSNAVSAAALIQDYGFGVIMGEQTVDMATTYGAMERFTLPNTGIVVSYPKALIVRPNGNESIHPLSPDVALPSPKVRGAMDIMLEAALKHIQSE